jgi:hypothetical protein
LISFERAWGGFGRKIALQWYGRVRRCVALRGGM